MAALDKPESLQREIRKVSMPDIGKSTWTLAKEALRAGDLMQAEKFMDQGYLGMKDVHDMIVKTTLNGWNM
ncbi:MAG: hypothetical protein JW882_11410 [Deltaproteobacteria bacterium]|nr:hypothetical protein [Deltaproteobacteria bacterium]